jgi:hypothetical protein
MYQVATFVLVSFFGLFFDREEGGDVFLSSFALLSLDYMAFIPENIILRNHR